MSDFRSVAHPPTSPMKCRFCGDFQGPMVDTYCDDVIFGGRIYICGPTDKRPGCIGQMAQLYGYSHPSDIALLNDRIEELQASLDRLSSEKQVTIPFSEFRQLFPNYELPADAVITLG